MMHCYVWIDNAELQLWWLKQGQLIRYQSLPVEQLQQCFALVKVVRKVPAMQGAFAEFSKQRGFLPYSKSADIWSEGQKIIASVAPSVEAGKVWRLSANHGLNTRSGRWLPNSSSAEADHAWLDKFWSELKTLAGAQATPAYLAAGDDAIIYHLLASWLPRQVDSLHLASVNLGSQLQAIFPELKIVQQSDTELAEKLSTAPLSASQQQRVALQGGGFIAIEKTLALTAIDVNSGSALADSGLSALALNLKAASAIAQQILLRDIGGLLVIDFLRMPDKKQRKELIRHLKQCLADDWRHHHMSGFSDFGLVEMSRQYG